MIMTKTTFVAFAALFLAGWIGTRPAQPELYAWEAAPTPLPRVAVTKSSEDGRELFEFVVFEPWAAAGRRVISLQAAYIDGNGFVGNATQRTSDLGTPAEPLTAVGGRFQCTVTPLVADWVSVISKDHVRIEVQPKP